MKTKMITTIATVLLVIAYSGCSDDSVPIDKTQLKKLAKTWTMTSVQLDGVDNTDYYQGLSLTISGTDPESFTYSVSGRPHYSPWPDNGHFIFGDDVKTTLIRDAGLAGELILTYEVTGSTLEFTFTFSGDPYNARTSNVEGNWTFVFGL